MGDYGALGLDGKGVMGNCANGIGVYGSGDNGVRGENSGNGNYGFIGSSFYGVYGRNVVNNNYGYLGSSDYGVYGKNINSDNYGYLGSNLWGGYFHGDVHVDGDVAIGTTSPVAKLDVNGAINTDSLYRIGGNTVLSAEGTSNIFVGTGAGENNTGSQVTFVGKEAGSRNQGNGNTFCGTVAGYSNTTGSRNTFLGNTAGRHNTEGGYNTFAGLGAGQSNTTGANNTFVGAEAGLTNETGTGNVFIGKSAGLNETNSNRLYIDNSNTDSPLIWGNFSWRELVINGNYSHNMSNRTFFVNGSAGGTTGWFNDSDERLKRNIESIPDALQKVRQLRGVNFEWIDTESYDSGRQMGFVAQEAVQVIPEVVSGEDGHYAMQYGPITALLVEAVKEQQGIIESQQVQIKELITRIAALEK
jgi:hypothetical protein